MSAMPVKSNCSSTKPLNLSSARKVSSVILKCALFTILLPIEVAVAHGRLNEPPSRSTMWRFGFKTPPNYQDHELYCGGLSRMIQNGGKCGICGDAADEQQPRPNEVGGKYANGVIVREYRVNQKIEAQVELTAHHKGYFEFKLCPTNNPKIDPTQECFDKHALALAADRSQFRHYVPKMMPDGRYRMKYVLPQGLSCSFCVLQWTYVAGNNWGKCENGTEGMGCGPQETFRACADVSIGQIGANPIDVETNEIEGSSSSASLRKQTDYKVLIIGAILVFRSIFLLM